MELASGLALCHRPPIAIVKVIEVISEGSSIENALESAVEEASKSLRDIKSVYAESITALVSDGKVTKYRVNAKVSFLVE